MSEFISPEFNRDIMINVIQQVYPQLNLVEQQLLHNHLVDITNTIIIKFNLYIKDRSVYIKQFTQNNYRDLKTLLDILLPFVDGDKTKIRNLNDIYVSKIKPCDINKDSPRYTYSNIQYNRCIRDKDGIKEILFKKEHIEQNVYLLKDTIQKCANKLFINWIDVLPLVRTDNESNIYNSIMAQTHHKIMNNRLREWNYTDNNDEYRTYSGLSVRDIYNCISIDLFEDIKNIKWLIYDGNYDNKLVSYMLMIQLILDSEGYVNGITWNELTDSQRKNFDSSWKGLIIRAYNKNGYGHINSDTIEQFLKSIMFFFNKYYDNMNTAIKDGYTRFKYKDSDMDDIKIFQFDLNKLKESIDSLNSKHIYSFIIEQYKKFRETYYFTLLDVSDNEFMKKIDVYGEGDISDTTEITPKNLYNICKSLLHHKPDGSKAYIRYGIYWESLTQSYKKIFLDRINNKVENLLNWFNISKYMEKMSITTKKQEYHQNIYDKFKEGISYIVLNILMNKGVMSEFIPTPEISDDLLKIDKNDYKETIQKIKEINMSSEKKKLWDDCRYFLSKKKYSQLTGYIIKDKKSGKGKKYDFYDYNIKELTWFTMFAMNWASQINFYHRYNHNRIIFVTGSTGVGKSTQIPKLLLYSLVMMDYKNDGKVVCTQPRIPPTLENSRRIASELSMPIESYSNAFQTKVMNDKFYVQYKFREGRHTVKDDMLNLKITTDGTLLQEMKNPLLTKRYYNSTTDSYTYTNKNTSDILILDESHEHGANMDLIATLVRELVDRNNSLKFVIISATMDADEPIYRRFYRTINDNLKYPIDTTLKKYNLDRHNVDRRMHIAPPGSTTRFNIEEYYTPGGDPTEIAVKIVNESSSGDILLFEPGEMEIKNRIQDLNNRLPSNTIALPYFSNMPQSKKDYIQNIDKNISNYVYGKSVDFSAPVKDELIKDRVPPNTYSRVILVATNIAEASITISSLKFVIDTGTQKVSIYNENTQSASIELKYITESSRLQRKGRVGRTSSGKVYYMYEENALIENKTAFEISTSDVSETLYSLLRKHNTETKLLPNTIFESVSEEFQEFMEHHYYVGGKMVDYIGNPNHYDYENDTNRFSYYETGYSKETLTDNNGSFYIIHPDELKLNRNLNGIITDTIDMPLKRNIVDSIKMKGFWNNLQEQLFISMNDNICIKTDYGYHLSQLKEKLQIDDIRTLISYIFGIQYGVAEEMSIIIPMLQTLNLTITSWVYSYYTNDNKFRYKLDDFRSLYSNKYGDIHGLYTCAKNLLDQIKSKYSSRTSALKMDTFDKNILSKQKSLYIDYIKNKDKYEYKTVQGLTYDTYNTFKQIDIDGNMTHSTTITTNEVNTLLQNNADINIFKEILNNDKGYIEDYCKKHYMNSITVISYIKNYYRFNSAISKYNNKIYDINHDEKNNDLEINQFKNFLYRFNSISTNNMENITYSLLHGYSKNIVKNMEGSKYYLSLYNPQPSNTYKIKTINKYIDIIDGVLKQEYKYNYLLYLNKDKNNDLSAVQYIDATKIQSIIPFVYTPINTYKLYDVKTNFNLLVNESEIDKYKRHVLHNYYIKTLQKCKTMLKNSYNINIWKKLSPLVQDTNIQRTILLKHIETNKIYSRI